MRLDPLLRRLRAAGMLRRLHQALVVLGFGSVAIAAWLLFLTDIKANGHWFLSSLAVAALAYAAALALWGWEASAEAEGGDDVS